MAGRKLITGTVQIISEDQETLLTAYRALAPVVEVFNAESQGNGLVYGISKQLLTSPTDKIQGDEGTFDVDEDEKKTFAKFNRAPPQAAVFVIAVPRNLRRLCIMDEHDDDDYKQIIAQARGRGFVLIAIVGQTVPPTSIQPVSNGLYDSTLDKLFEAQPQLRWFRDRDCFLSFVEWLTPLQVKAKEMKSMKEALLKRQKEELEAFDAAKTRAEDTELARIVAPPMSRLQALELQHLFSGLLAPLPNRKGRPATR